MCVCGCVCVCGCGCVCGCVCVCVCVCGYEERRDTAFSVMENGVVSGHGFYATSYQSLYVMGQCEGDVGDSDCGECVKSAVQRAQVECGSSTLFP